MGVGLIPSAIAGCPSARERIGRQCHFVVDYNYVAYTHGNATAANPRLTPVTIGWVNQQGGGLAFPNATLGAQPRSST